MGYTLECIYAKWCMLVLPLSHHSRHWVSPQFSSELGKLMQSLLSPGPLVSHSPSYFSDQLLLLPLTFQPPLIIGPDSSAYLRRSGTGPWIVHTPLTSRPWMQIFFRRAGWTITLVPLGCSSISTIGIPSLCGSCLLDCGWAPCSDLKRPLGAISHHSHRYISSQTLLRT